jgi:hypothetical protein
MAELLALSRQPTTNITKKQFSSNNFEPPFLQARCYWLASLVVLQEMQTQAFHNGFDLQIVPVNRKNFITLVCEPHFNLTCQTQAVHKALMMHY